MDENLNQSNPEQNSSPDNQSPEKTNQESGNTYWESQKTDSNQSTTSSPETLQAQPTSQGLNDSNVNFVSQQPKKKKSKGLVALIIILVLLASGIGVALANKKQIMNTLSLSSKSPKEYYALLEQESFNKTLDDLNADMLGSSKKDNIAVKSSLNLSYDKNTVNSLLQTAIGISITDVEDSLGLTLDNIGLEATVAYQDSVLYENLGLSLNQIDLISAEIFINLLEENLLMRFPELSPAYLSQSASELGTSYDMNEYLAKIQNIDAKDTKDFIKRYFTIITDNVNDVELAKNGELSINDLTSKVNILTVTIDEDNMVEILSKILSEALNDSYLIDLCSAMGISKADYQDLLQDALDELSNYNDEFADTEIVMDIYVDKKGDILGREIKLTSGDERLGSLGYSQIISGDKEEYEFFVKGDSNNKIVSIAGEQTNHKGAYTGEADISVDASDYLGETYKFNLAYEDVKTEIKNETPYYYGKYTLSSKLLMGASIGVDLDVASKVQKADIYVTMGGSKLVTLALTNEYLDSFTIPTPAADADVYDILVESDYYASTIDITTFISDLSAKLGVDLNELLGYVAPYLY